MNRLIIIALLFSCNTAPVPDLTHELLPLMEAQEQDWSGGNIDGFMEIYHENVCFLGGNKLTCGKKEVTENYKKRYPNAESMGKLAFSNSEYVSAGSNYAWVTGRWNLFRVADTLEGSYSLLWKKTENGWRIFRDHSDSDCN